MWAIGSGQAHAIFAPPHVEDRQLIHLVRHPVRRAPRLNELPNGSRIEQTVLGAVGEILEHRGPRPTQPAAKRDRESLLAMRIEPSGQPLARHVPQQKLAPSPARALSWTQGTKGEFDDLPV